MKPRISLITLGVRDLDRARRFYVDGLGWPVHPIDSDEVVFLPLEGTWLGLFGWDDLAKDATVDGQGSGFRGVSLAHNVATREAVDEVLALAKRAGATIPKPAVEPPHGGYSGYFADPDGHLWEVAWQPSLPLA